MFIVCPIREEVNEKDAGGANRVEIILYLSAALAAIAFFILVLFIGRTLKSLQGTLDHVSHTLAGLEKQLDGVTRETTELLHKTNTLAEDIQEKSERLNVVVDAVKDVGESIGQFNQSVKKITSSVNTQIDQNKERVSQVIQWSNVLLELKDKWTEKKSSRQKKEQQHERKIQENG